MELVKNHDMYFQKNSNVKSIEQIAVETFTRTLIQAGNLKEKNSINIRNEAEEKVRGIV